LTPEAVEWPPSAQDLRATFDARELFTVGLEDEVMLLEIESLELAARADRVLEAVRGDARFKPELPASQIEIVTAPAATVGEVVAMLLESRRDLSERTSDVARLASAGVHPFSSGAGTLNALPRYEHTAREYGPVAERELVCALQVQVAVGDADRALAVYNAARSYLPLIAAVAANAPYYEGRDTGLASVRPKLAELLPRQGVPPAIASWEHYAQALRWGTETGFFADPGAWWWELRPNPRFGTLEFRVPDAQSTVTDAAGIAALAQSLVAWLGQRYDAAEPLAVVESWRIAENRWSACRHGVEGEMGDLVNGRRRPTRDCLDELLEDLAPLARGLGCERALTQVSRLLDFNGAMAQRAVGQAGGPRTVARWLVDRFLEPSSG
jgi:glutamate---cysteine ligase / carboxylate-amine ligase